MSLQQIQNLMQQLSNLHQNFQQNDYQLSQLDYQSIKNCIEQLNTFIISEKATTNFHSSPIPTLTQIQQTPTVEASAPVEDVNNEIDELFFPQPSTSQEPNNIQLGINERIMFAKELFNNNVDELYQQLRTFQSYPTVNDAFQYFDQQFAKNLLQKGKNEEIIQEFRQLIARLYS